METWWYLGYRSGIGVYAIYGIKEVLPLWMCCVPHDSLEEDRARLDDLMC